ncbi:aspartyl protease AED1-like [Macadamia integrifolia]|uniref:aspartyl protease AED1-like n=1 Tax=Macadamia integrifolia TaxID=60698 RepID=UPI001C4F492A|nr:aspartyl protease AED1-like [Macadamia integrifolia]
MRKMLDLHMYIQVNLCAAVPNSNYSLEIMVRSNSALLITYSLSQWPVPFQSMNSPSFFWDKAERLYESSVAYYAYIASKKNYGLLATEILSFKDSDRVVTGSVRDVVFGCGDNNHNSVHGKFGEILGLTATDLSVVSQLHSITKRKFSYCLGNASDPSSEGNLIIGEDAHMIKLVGIRVGLQFLDIPSRNVTLDSGTIYTFLPPEVYGKLLAAISQTMKRFKVQPIPPRRIGRLCYIGSISKDLNGFSTMTIGFLENDELVLERWSIFIQHEFAIFCLAFLPSGGPNEPGIIGSMA